MILIISTHKDKNNSEKLRKIHQRRVILIREGIYRLGEENGWKGERKVRPFLVLFLTLRWR